MSLCVLSFEHALDGDSDKSEGMTKGSVLDVVNVCDDIETIVCGLSLLNVCGSCFVFCKCCFVVKDGSKDLRKGLGRHRTVIVYFVCRAGGWLGN